MSGFTTIDAEKFEARCLKLLDEVARTGETLVITRRGRPIARLVPAPHGVTPFGALVGSVVAQDDIVSPVEGAWDAD